MSGWLDCIYSDSALAVALSVPDQWARQHPVAVSSSPDLTVRSLQTLRVEGGAQLLEIGVGSGYTTALLAHLLGEAHVTSIEIDPDLLSAAAQRLDMLDVHPTLLRGDGATESTFAAGERYDRVIVGFEVETVAPSWIRCTRPGARLLARIGGTLGAGRHVLLARRCAATTEPELVGRFQDWPGTLPARRHPAGQNPTRHPSTAPHAWLTRQGSTSVSPTDLIDDAPLAMLAQLHLPPGTTRSVRSAGTETATYLTAPDGSWAEVLHTFDHRGRHDTRYAGPTPLLPRLEDAYDTYRDLGAPGWNAFGVTATTTDTRIWHDKPTGAAWPIHPNHPHGRHQT
ncbi:MAG: methyltransferase domain-containing protein [Pseudonocardia sp.]